MSLLKKVRGQKRADELLSRSFSKGRLAHAYLFAGPSGVGRLTAALELAAAWMCSDDEHGYCGKCRNCQRVFRFQHPDVRLTIPQTGNTEPEEIADLLQSRVDDGITPVRFQGNTRISIGQIRELQKRISMKAYEDRGHIEIIPDAERMGVEAANALLKTLEEPPDETVIILISSIWSALLPTVRSRLHLIRFRRLSDNTIRDILMDRMGLGEEEAFCIAESSDGRPGLALSRGDSASVVEGEYGSETVLRKLTECGTAISAVSLASEVSRKLGREGSLEFCKNMQSFIHDLRRCTLENKPLVHSSKTLQGFNISDDAFSSGMNYFRIAEKRLAGNGMAKIVLSAAFAGTWISIVSSGKDSSIELQR
jgi:DNA polymerase-3 subunit delta'